MAVDVDQAGHNQPAVEFYHLDPVSPVEDVPHGRDAPVLDTHLTRPKTPSVQGFAAGQDDVEQRIFP